jgi:cytochrome oxidase Cu insertion factor (SCO1/SenC/PrrC family)
VATWSAVAVGALGACSAAPAAPASPAAPAAQVSRASDGPPGASVGTALDSPVPASVLDLPFTTADGRTVRLRDFTGKVVALSDMMTLCQETCPVDTAGFVSTDRDEASAGHSADEVFLSITVDPSRDTTAQLAAYRRLYAPAPANWLTLTGSRADVKALWDYLGVWRQKVPEPAGTTPRSWRTNEPLTYDVQHSDEVFFLDRSQHERFVLEGPPYVAGGSLPATLKSFLDDRGRQNLAHPQSSDWTEAQARSVLTWLR